MISLWHFCPLESTCAMVFLLCLGVQPRSTVLSSHRVSANPGPVTIPVPLCPYLLCELGVYGKGCGILLTGICYHMKVTFHVTIWFDALSGAHAVQLESVSHAFILNCYLEATVQQIRR